MSDSLQKEILALRALYRSERDPAGRAFAPLADAYRRAGEHEQARELLAEGLVRLPEFAPGHVVSAWLHRDRGETEDARSAFRHVLDLDSDNIEALRGLAVLLDDAGEDPDEVRSLLERAVELDPNDLEIRARLQRPVGGAPAAPGSASPEAASPAPAAPGETGRPPLADATAAAVPAPPEADDGLLDISGLPGAVGDEAAGEDADEDLAFLDLDGLDGLDDVDELEGDAPLPAVDPAGEDDALPAFDSDDAAEAALPEVGLEDADAAPPPELGGEDELPGAAEEDEVFVEPLPTLGGEDDPDAFLDEEEGVAEPLPGLDDDVPADVVDVADLAPDAPEPAPATTAEAGETSRPAPTGATGGASAIRTRTMAELLAKQGFPDRAADILEELAAADPSDAGLGERARELRARSAEGYPSAPSAPERAAPAEPDAEELAEELAQTGSEPTGERDGPFAWGGDGAAETEGDEAASGDDGLPVAGYFASLLRWRRGDTAAPDAAARASEVDLPEPLVEADAASELLLVEQTRVDLEAGVFDDEGGAPDDGADDGAVDVASLAPDGVAGPVDVASLAPDPPDPARGGGGADVVDIASLAPDGGVVDVRSLAPDAP